MSQTQQLEQVERLANDRDFIEAFEERRLKDFIEGSVNTDDLGSLY